MEKFYAGIGSREVPSHIKNLIIRAAFFLANTGWVLRSGGANGCDNAFEEGCDQANGKKEIFLPWKGFNRNNSGLVLDNSPKFSKAEIIAANFHPAWDNLSQSARFFHTRNVYQVLGWNLNAGEESKFIICYTKDGQATGGTGQALRIAEHYHIKIYNLYYQRVREKIEKTIDS